MALVILFILLGFAVERGMTLAVPETAARWRFGLFADACAVKAVARKGIMVWKRLTNS